MSDYQAIIERIRKEITPLIGKGKVADYIPILSTVSKDKFGMAVQMRDGRLYSTGDATENFSIQSISKVITLTLALKEVGEKEVFRRVGREPSGTAFNSLVQLEFENGFPRNPFINAGAIVIDDIIVSAMNQAKDSLLELIRSLSQNESIEYDQSVARSEKEFGFRNRALANFIKSFGNLKSEVDDVLDLYFSHCSLSMNCIDLARCFLFLANQGVCPFTEKRIVTKSQAKRINALMMTCGTYDAVGEFAYLVGLPAKSGVGGGIVAVIPNHLAVSVWSPSLNKCGNSLAGTKALELFTTKTGISVF